MDDRRLNVIIVGSGLAGLTAACILKAHHNVTVYERGNKDVATGGQGIMIAANGAKILRSIDFDTGRAGSVEIIGLTTYNKRNNMLEDASFDFRAEFGANYMAQKRSDFRDELLRLATTGSYPAKIEFNKNVTSLDPEGSVRIDDGKTIAADLIVVADGVHSRLRKLIVGEGHVARKTGLTCYRTIVSLQDAKEVLGEAGLSRWMKQSASSLISGADGTACIITVYPIRHRSRSQIWELQDLEPLPHWAKGKAILIGNAAHAMTPMQGQGANMAIEGAEAFRLLQSCDHVEEVLQTIQNVRRARVLEVLNETRKSHSTTGIAARVIKNLGFNCGYNGILEAVKQEKAISTVVVGPKGATA